MVHIIFQMFGYLFTFMGINRYEIVVCYGNSDVKLIPQVILTFVIITCFKSSQILTKMLFSIDLKPDSLITTEYFFAIIKDTVYTILIPRTS